MMIISASTIAVEAYAKIFASPINYQMVYRSPTIGLDNLWGLRTASNNTAVISIRGTTQKPESWLANFYAAMVPAKGKIKINEQEEFSYQFAANSKATVHLGWLFSIAYSPKEMLHKIKDLYSSGLYFKYWKC